MSDIQRFNYRCFITRIEDGTEVLVQIFDDPDTNKTLHAQIAFRGPYGSTWGIPYQLEAK